jgi:hypothetical protein
VRRRHDLRAGSDDNAVRLRIAAVASIAGGVEDIGAMLIVQDRGAAVIAAIGVLVATQVGQRKCVAQNRRCERRRLSIPSS